MKDGPIVEDGPIVDVDAGEEDRWGPSAAASPG